MITNLTDLHKSGWTLPADLYTTEDAFQADLNVLKKNWLYVATEDGLLLCFDVATGKIEKTIRDFGIETSGKDNAEISGLVHHVHKSLLGGYSNDKGLKRGRLVLWK